MKRAVLILGILFALVFGAVFQPAPVFAQEINEQERIAELQAIVLQLFKLVEELQRQLFNIQAARMSVIPSVAPSALGCGQAEITWEKVSGATGYVLYRNGSEVYDGKELKFLDKGLVPGATYVYTVRARNAGGLGAASPVTTITVPSECPPAAPFVWAQAGACGGTLQVSWSRPEGVTFYEVYRGNTRVFSGSKFSFLDRGLSVGKTYSYKVRAGNAGGWGAFSKEASATASVVCPPLAPAAPEVGSPLLQDIADEGILTLAIQASPSGATAQSGGDGVNILSFRATAKLSAMAVERVDVEFTDRPWLFLSDVELRDGSQTVARVSVSENSFARMDTDRYRLSFTGLSLQVSKGGSKTLSVRVVAREGLLLAEPRAFTVAIPANSVRARDQIGVVHSGPLAEQANSFAKTFFVRKK